MPKPLYELKGELVQIEFDNAAEMSVTFYQPAVPEPAGSHQLVIMVSPEATEKHNTITVKIGDKGWQFTKL